MFDSGVNPPRDLRAQAAVRRAMAASYRLPPSFPGFRAEVGFWIDGQSWLGELQLRSPDEIVLADRDTSGSGDLHHLVAAIARHLWVEPDSLRDANERIHFQDENDHHPLGRSVIVDGEHGATTYRVRNDQIVQKINETDENRRSTLIQARVNLADGRTLPSHFTVFEWSLPDERLTRVSVYEDHFTEVEGLYLPLARRIVRAGDGGTETVIVEFDRHQLFVSDTDAGAAGWSNGRHGSNGSTG